MQHIPVLLQEVLQYLNPQPGKLYVDATLGGGGHAHAVLERCFEQASTGCLLWGLDQDPVALKEAEKRLAPYQPGVQLIEANYSTLPQVMETRGVASLSGGVLADLGVSSFQLDEGARGFSFQQDAPLDMRMSPRGETTAADLVNTLPEGELIRLFSTYGEERFSKSIAYAIVQARKQAPIETTKELAGIILDVYGRRQPPSKNRQGIHPATLVFQALRIAVNQEFAHLERFLDQLPALLAPGARLVVISFHSLEDRIVKRFLQREVRGCICPPRFPICQCGHQPTLEILTPKPVMATEAEIANNPRSRSAKLRAAQRI